MAEPPRYVLLGAVAGAFGVRGEVRIKSFTAAPQELFAYGPFTDEAGRVVLTVRRWRPIKDGFAAVCAEVPTREAAAALKSTRLHAPRERLPALPEDEFYHADLIGLAVKTLDGAPLGEVRAVHDFGSGDLLEVWRTPGVAGAWYLPFTRRAVPHVDVAAGEIIADPPEEDDAEPEP
ncbi:MAG: ribosome maturation factor RimM [Caulobacterales bacterium]|nr:ribosome maturation factor RimM [Caulobacterales bacterium]